MEKKLLLGQLVALSGIEIMFGTEGIFHLTYHPF